MSALIQAVRNQNPDAVAEALANYATPENENATGRNAMYYAERIALGGPRGMITNLLETATYVDELEDELVDALYGEKPPTFTEKLQQLRSAVYTAALQYDSPGDYAFAIYDSAMDIAKRARGEIIGHGGTSRVANEGALSAAIASAEYYIDEDSLSVGMEALEARRQGAEIREAEEEFNAIVAAHAAQVARNTNEGDIGTVPTSEARNQPAEDPGSLLGGKRARRSKRSRTKKLRKTLKKSKYQKTLRKK